MKIKSVYSLCGSIVASIQIPSFNVGLATIGIQHDWNSSDSFDISISLHIPVKNKLGLSNSHLAILKLC